MNLEPRNARRLLDIRLPLTLVLVAVTSATLLGAGAAARADDSENFAAASPWGRYFKMAPFQTHTLEVTVATDKQSGRQMNLVRLPNGHVMALVPADCYMSLIEKTSEQDMVPMK